MASVQDKLVLSELNLRKIVQFRPGREGYWVLTEYGTDIILYLEKNPEVLHEEGSLGK